MRSSKSQPEYKSPPTVFGALKHGLRESYRNRSISFYLMLAIIAVLLLGLQMANIRDNPKVFALYLSLMFVFFFAVMVRAILECTDAVRRHFSESKDLYRTTLGDESFAAELGRRVQENRDKP